MKQSLPLFWRHPFALRFEVGRLTEWLPRNCDFAVIVEAIIRRVHAIKYRMRPQRFGPESHGIDAIDRQREEQISIRAGDGSPLPANVK
jgi:hypothetical protein